MQLPIIGHRGQVKPYGSIPRINWLHPLACGLVSYGYDVGSGPIDLVTGGQRTIANSTNPPFGGPKGSKYGPALSSISTGSITTGLYTLPGGSNIENLCVAAPYSAACGLMLTAAPSSFSTLFSTCDAAAHCEIQIGVNSSTAYFFEYVSGSAQVAAASISLNRFQTLLQVALTGTAGTCYVDGTLSLSPAVTTIEAAHAGTAPAFHGLRSSAAQTLTTSQIYYGALWENRALTASEARLLHDDPYCFLIYPEDEIFASSIGTARRLHPDADSIAGSWTNELGGTTLFSSIDEISVSDDTDYIQSSSNPSSDICKISLSNPSTSVGSPVVRYRYKKKDNSPTAANLTVRLLQGVTEIASWTHTGISTSFVTTEQTLSAPQLASITDFSDLYIELTADS